MDTTLKAVLICVLISLIVVDGQNATRFKVLYEWNYINFTWPSWEVEQSAVAAGKYVPDNNIISGIKYFDGFLYFTVPRMKEGVPATLARVPYDSKSNDTSPPLEPYPSWDMNVEGECKSLQNVQNIEIDTQGRIWILDIGRTATMTKLPNNECPPRLLIYDIKTKSITANYPFTKNVTGESCYPYDLVVDEVDGTYAYITDNSYSDPGILVYSLKKNKAWKIRDDTSMRADPDAVEFRVNGTAISVPINIAGIALGSRKTVNKNEEIVSLDRSVYFCPLSSRSLYQTNSDVLRDERTTEIRNQVKNLGRKASQTDGMIMDENGVLYYGLLSDNSISRWDSQTPFTSEQKVIARDKTFIQWPNSFAFDQSGHLLVVTNKLQRYINGQIDPSEPNYRVLEGNVGVKSYLYGETTEVPVRVKTQHEVNVEGGTENMNSSLHYNIHSSPINHWDKFKSNNNTNDAIALSGGLIVTVSCLVLSRL